MHPDSCDLVLLEFIEYIPVIASEMGSFTRSPGTSLPALPQARLLRSSAGLYSRLVQFLFVVMYRLFDLVLRYQKWVKI